MSHPKIATVFVGAGLALALVAGCGRQLQSQPARTNSVQLRDGYSGLVTCPKGETPKVVAQEGRSVTLVCPQGGNPVVTQVPEGTK
jgi:hypothetical protein